MHRVTLKDMFRTLQECGETRIRIDRATPDLVAEAIVMGANHRSWEDPQIMGRFHHYTVKQGNVEVELITTNPVSKEEAQAAAYMGFTLEECRRYRKK